MSVNVNSFVARLLEDGTSRMALMAAFVVQIKWLDANKSKLSSEEAEFVEDSMRRWKNGTPGVLPKGAPRINQLYKTYGPPIDKSRW